MLLRQAVAFVPILNPGEDHAQKAAEQLNKLIGEQHATGWTFSHLDSFTRYVPAGCLAGLLGHKAELASINLAIFERPA